MRGGSRYRPGRSSESASASRLSGSAGLANAAALALTPEPAPIAPTPTVPDPASTPAQRIEAALADLETAATLDDLRCACRMRTHSLCDALAELVRAGKVVKSAAGYRLA